MSEVKTKKRALINIDYIFTGDGVDDVYMEKKRLKKWLESLKETTPEITDVQCIIQERRGEKTGDISKMKFRNV